MAFDLNHFDGIAKTFEDGADVEIRHPVTNEPLGLTIRVASYQSERVRKVQRRMANTALREQRRNPKKATTTEEIEERSKEVVAAAIISWTGFEKAGEPFPCTPENIAAVLGNPDLWFIGDQVDRAADDQSAFLKA